MYPSIRDIEGKIVKKNKWIGPINHFNISIVYETLVFEISKFNYTCMATHGNFVLPV